jgi:hypothetical protein
MLKISQTTKINILYLIVIALMVSYIMNKQSLAVVSLLFIGGFVYILSKNIIISLIIAIIITNLLLSTNYFVEGHEGMTLENKKDTSNKDTSNKDTSKEDKKNENQINKD